MQERNYFPVEEIAVRVLSAESTNFLILKEATSEGDLKFYLLMDLTDSVSKDFKSESNHAV